jgi:hypothetical protein
MMLRTFAQELGEVRAWHPKPSSRSVHPNVGAFV